MMAGTLSARSIISEPLFCSGVLGVLFATNCYGRYSMVVS